MLADYFIKLLKGNVFKTFRDVIMGYTHIFSLESIPVSMNEHVGNNREILENVSDRKSDLALLSH